MNEALHVDLRIDDCWNRIGVWRKSDDPCPRLDEVVHCYNCDVYASAGRKLLERSAPAGYLAEWTALLNREKQERISGNISVIVFRLGDEWMALPTQACLKITRMCPIHSLPHAPSELVRGLVNADGEMHICMSLGRLLGIMKGEEEPSDQKNLVLERLIVAARDDQRFVFPVSEIKCVHRYHESELGDPPTTLHHAASSYIKGAFELEDHTVACLDDELVIHTFTRSLT